MLEMLNKYRKVSFYSSSKILYHTEGVSSFLDF
jgi:hypothetical protein